MYIFVTPSGVYDSNIHKINATSQHNHYVQICHSARSLLLQHSQNKRNFSPPPLTYKFVTPPGVHYSNIHKTNATPTSILICHSARSLLFQQSQNNNQIQAPPTYVQICHSARSLLLQQIKTNNPPQLPRLILTPPSANSPNIHKNPLFSTTTKQKKIRTKGADSKLKTKTTTPPPSNTAHYAYCF